MCTWGMPCVPRFLDKWNASGVSQATLFRLCIEWKRNEEDISCSAATDDDYDGGGLFYFLKKTPFLYVRSLRSLRVLSGIEHKKRAHKILVRWISYSLFLRIIFNFKEISRMFLSLASFEAFCCLRLFFIFWILMMFSSVHVRSSVSEWCFWFLCCRLLDDAKMSE